MSRRKRQDDHENHERWLVSYADFITLLFAFFVVMYSISSVNEGKYRVLSDALVSAFHAPPKSLEPIQVGRPAKSPVLADIQLRSSPTLMKAPSVSIRDKNISMGSKEDTRKEDIYDKAAAKEAQRDLQKMADAIEKAMEHLVEQKLVSVKRTDFWIEVEIKSSILFQSGSSLLQNSIIPILKQVAAILSGFNNPVRVEGFTDNLPIDNIIYPSNWELSVSRAASVVRILQGNGVGPERLSAAGYSQYRPVADNLTRVGRAKNRRVVIVVMANHDVEMLFSR